MATTAAAAATAVGRGTGAASAFLTLSFSGAGHLLPYHLGVASSLYQCYRRTRSIGGSSSSTTTTTQNSATSTSGSRRTNLIKSKAGRRGRGGQMPPIRAVSGSSSGAIAAAVFVRLPHRLDEYSDRFLADGGKALHHLTEMLHDEERRGGPSSSPDNRVGSEPAAAPPPPRRTPSLHVATTRCSDGNLHLFHFPSISSTFRTISSSWSTDDLLTSIRASCRIPSTFHPADVLEPWWGGRESSSERIMSALSYPDTDGIRIDGTCYVDGGIAAPAPPTPLDGEDGAVRVIVSPMSGSAAAADAATTRAAAAAVRRISPPDNTWNLVPFPPELRCRGNFRVRPSVQNLRALRVSAGAASSEELRDWYDRGVEDGEDMVTRSGWS